MSFGHPCRSISQFVGELDAVNKVLRLKTTGKGEPDSFHQNTSLRLTAGGGIALASGKEYDVAYRIYIADTVSAEFTYIPSPPGM